MNAPARTKPRPLVVLVTGLSGSGKASVLRTLEDLGYDAVDNAPLDIVDDLIRRGQPRCAIGRKAQRLPRHVCGRGISVWHAVSFDQLI